MSRLSFLVVVLAGFLLQLTSAFLPMRTALPAVSRAALQPRSSSPAGRRKSVAVMGMEYWEVRSDVDRLILQAGGGAGGGWMLLRWDRSTRQGWRLNMRCSSAVGF